MFASTTLEPPPTHVEPGVVPLERLEDELRQWAADLTAGEARFLQLIAEFDRRGGWKQWGMASCGHWLSWQCGLTPGAARERVRVARALEDLPLTASAFASGQLSYSKVRALTRLVDAEIEAEFVSLAQSLTASQLERLVGATKRAMQRDDLDAVNERHANRSFSHGWENDGSLVGTFRMPPEEGAAFMAGVDEFMERPATKTEQEAGADWLPISVRRSDALGTMAAAAVGASPRPAGERTMVVVEVDAEVLAGDADGQCRIRNGPGLAAETARRLSCDATITVVPRGAAVDGAVETKPTRSIPRSTRRAVARRDKGVCQYPGCHTMLGCEIHHIIHRAHGGSHDLSNLITLCRRHHHLVHEGGFTVEVEPHGPPTFARPDGTLVARAATPPPSQVEALPNANVSAGLTITPETLWPGYNERLDLVLATQILIHNISLERERNQRNVSAVTPASDPTAARATGTSPPI